MTVALSCQNLRKSIARAIEGFRDTDLIGVSDSWLSIYEVLADYISGDRELDQKLMWMIEGTDDSLSDIIYLLQRLKKALVLEIVARGAHDELDLVLSWFDRAVVTLVEKQSGKMCMERSLSKPFETIFWNARDGMYISTIEGKFLHANEALVKMFKYDSLEAMLSMDIQRDLYVNKEERQVLLDHLLQDGFFDQHEFHFHCVDGETRTALESCYIVDVPGYPAYIVGILVDVTAEKETQRKTENYVKSVEKSSMEALHRLHSTNRRHDAVLALNDHPVALIDAVDFHIVHRNQAFNKRFKYKTKELSDITFRDLFTKEQWITIFTRISESVHRHHYHIRGINCLTNGGQPFVADLSVLAHQDGRFTQLFVQFEELSEIVHIKSLLSQERENIEELMKHVPVGVIGFKSDGSIAFINNYLYNFFGYGSRQMHSISFINRLFAQDEHRLKFHKYIRRFLAGRHVQDVLVDLKSRSGEILHFGMSTIAHQFADDDKPGFLALLTNITDKLRLEAILAQQSDSDGNETHRLETSLAEVRSQLSAAERRNAFLQRFICEVVTKFKIPIHVVLGYASLLKKDLPKVVDQSQLEDLGIIDDHIHLMLRMLAKAAEFMALENGEIKPDPETLQARDMLDRLFKKLVPPATEDGVTFKQDNQILSLDLTVTCDRHILEAILRQHIDNALTFTEAGTITLSAYEERERLWIEIADTGPGIGPIDLPQVFEPFFQCAGLERPGLGLGLTIARKYAELANFRMELYSKPDKGTRALICVGKLDPVGS